MSLDKGDLPLNPPRRERGGIEGKWAALTDERETLREERDRLQSQVTQLLAEKEAAKKVEEFGLGMDEDEAQVMDALQFAYNRIANEWDLKAHHTQLVFALQLARSFVVQHMLNRLAPDRWPSWWKGKDEGDRTEDPPDRQATTG